MFTLEDAELKNIREAALMSSDPLVQKAVWQEQAFRMCTAQEIQELLTAVTQAISDKIEAETCDPEKYIAEIKTKTLQRLQKDFACARALDAALKDYRAVDRNPGEKECIYPLKSNKLTFEFGAVIQFVSEIDFQKLFFDNEIPKGYQFETKPDEITYLQRNANGIYGDWKNTILKTALLNIYFTVTGKNFSNLDLQGSQPLYDQFYGGKKLEHWVDRTAMVYVAPLPKKLDRKALAELNPDFENCTFVCEIEGQLYISCAHSGYCFGGESRANARPAKALPLRSEDCSSDIENLCSHPTSKQKMTMSTVDLGYSATLRDTTPENFAQKVSPAFLTAISGAATEKEAADNAAAWLQRPLAKQMEETFDVVRDWEKDPQRHIQSGLIYAHRKGRSGHTAPVIGFKSDGRESAVVLLGCSRNYGDRPPAEITGEGTEGGRGIHLLPLDPSPNSPKKAFFLQYKGGSTSSGALPLNTSLWPQKQATLNPKFRKKA